MSDGEFKYRKKYNKTFGRKRSDGNYGSDDEMGSYSLDIGFDSVDEIPELKKDIQAMVELDKFTFDIIDNAKGYLIRMATDTEKVDLGHGVSVPKTKIPPSQRSPQIAQSDILAKDEKDPSINERARDDITRLLLKYSFRQGEKQFANSFSKKENDLWWSVYINVDKEHGGYEVNAQAKDGNKNKINPKDSHFPELLRDIMNECQTILSDAKVSEINS